MTTIETFFTTDHRACDHRLADLEAAVAAGDWTCAQDRLHDFDRDLERHLGREEELLFPAIEAATGSTHGPTEVMRREHAQMRALLNDARAAIGQQDQAASLGLLETLMTLIQLHNVKEEQILYPMADRHLGPQRTALMDRVRDFVP
ncbi:hemerythrin domain-containing protein [Thioalkalicoccus limnaeus]|uniref:Hemerythrin domain-containing protein n=1 Tax=Thioalkalicoccus limnaeus TaxID=120681 RepID=A0ABV4BH85_9GAMM